MTQVPPDWLPMLENRLWPKDFCSRREDCNQDRCQQRLQVGQCHLRPEHPGMHDPFGLSHPYPENVTTLL